MSENASISAPKSMKLRYVEITTLINDFCSKKLSEEYVYIVLG